MTALARLALGAAALVVASAVIAVTVISLLDEIDDAISRVDWSTVPYSEQE